MHHADLARLSADLGWALYRAVDAAADDTLAALPPGALGAAHHAVDAFARDPQAAPRVEAARTASVALQRLEVALRTGDEVGAAGARHALRGAARALLGTLPMRPEFALATA